MLLADKTLFITGGSAGIGRATALAAARQGADIAIHYLGHDEGAHSAVAEIEQIGRRAIAIEGDVSDPASARRFVEEGTAALGALDIFVNNAGICPFHAFLDMPGEVFERTMNVNLHGAFYMVQAAANQMVRQGKGGAIVAVSSISALVGGEYQSHYTPTKAGVHSLMQSAAIALGRHGIRCNSVMPGTILTDINKEDLADAAKRQYMEGRIPLGRLGEPDDLAGPIIFLASDLARYVTGASLLVDGGMFVNLQ
ncbi:SDR family NAD(P)-dependent oxidoreductase [Sphingomonas abietis]|uniref:SDR family NAD(P)-dependent oxidoreductase n=1 Tax=Sphingomonas abietis TaxID=3012344 RepID=A0ABY7NKS2_9SPHN|nr:SDR family NAD(P)-dependent oxidoreductase [Sphingomonas abietis]WBO21948.1 SDR family NAD(P)-dependent oxidoreductase [Sphingomonas abietis]